VNVDPESAAPALADARTLDVLDFPQIRERVAREAMTDRAVARARALVPSVELAAVRSELAATAEMRAIAGADGFSLPRVVETSDAVQRAARSAPLSGDELRAIGTALAASEAAVRRVRAAEAPVLRARVDGVPPATQVVAKIAHAIGEHGEVLDRASHALGRIRRNVTSASAEARERTQSILRSAAFANAIQDNIVTSRAGRFVVPIKADFAGSVPGVVHDTSASGQTVFVEPLAALEVNNRVRTLRIEEEREVARVLAEVSAAVGAQADAVEANLAALSEIDLVLARARVAAAMDAVAPAIVGAPALDIRSGRHPLLGQRAVAQSLVLDEQTRFIVISGPNMGGKTVTLKMAGLFVAMAYCGLHVPAHEGTVIGAFTRVFADIGDEQSIAENTSTFSAHLRRLREIVAGAGDRTLVLIDEIASGTEPAASAALARSLLEALLASGSRGIVTTHATELKLFAHATPGLVNASVRFDPATYAPAYHLDIGAPGQSLAFALARTLGLPEDIVTRGEALMSEEEREYDRALAEVATIRTQAAADRDALARDRDHLATLQDNARRRSETLERERREFAQRADERLGRALREFANELERRTRESGAGRARVTSGQAALLGRVLSDVHRELGLQPANAAPGEAAPAVNVGDTVHVPSLGTDGTIADDYGDTVLVAVGAMRTVVPKTGVRVTGRAETRRRSRAGGGATMLEAAAGARHELDVRGKRFVEAEPIVDQWLDEAKLLGVSPLRLIHGKGTGLLGRGLQQYLKEHPDVAKVRYGNADEGGSGVTVLEMRP
jgi:DNA mismatch repair protein MutS2